MHNLMFVLQEIANEVRWTLTAEGGVPPDDADDLMSNARCVAQVRGIKFSDEADEIPAWCLLSLVVHDASGFPRLIEGRE